MIAPVPILRYHSVSDVPPRGLAPYTVSRRQFAAHLDQLTALGFLALTVGELILARESGMLLPERTAVITFDDGLADFATSAWPELAARELDATLYVTVGALGGTSRWLAPLGAGDLPLLTRRQVVELAAQGCEIGAHTMTHPQLDCLPRSAAAREITQSKSVLEHLLGRPVDSFAYPDGRHDAAVRQLVIDAGFRSAVAVRNELSSVGDDWFAMARLTVTADFDMAQLTELPTVAEPSGGPTRRAPAHPAVAPGPTPAVPTDERPQVRGLTLGFPVDRAADRQRMWPVCPPGSAEDGVHRAAAEDRIGHHGGGPGDAGPVTQNRRRDDQPGGGQAAGCARAGCRGCRA